MSVYNKTTHWNRHTVNGGGQMAHLIAVPLIYYNIAVYLIIWWQVGAIRPDWVMQAEILQLDPP